jgi:hypothetical protein
MKFFEVDHPTKGKDFNSKLSITKEGTQDKNIILQELSGSIRHNNENESTMKTFHVEFIVINGNKKGEILFEVQIIYIYIYIYINICIC